MDQTKDFPVHLSWVPLPILKTKGLLATAESSPSADAWESVYAYNMDNLKSNGSEKKQDVSPNAFNVNDSNHPEPTSSVNVNINKTCVSEKKEQMTSKVLPPWELDHPQPGCVSIFEKLKPSKGWKGTILDVGCGTGENTLYFQTIGFNDISGIDISASAIELARKKSIERHLRYEVSFYHMGLSSIDSFGCIFDVVFDSGCFHLLSNDDRREFKKQLERVLLPGGLFILLGYSCETIEKMGDVPQGKPRGVKRNDINDLFEVKKWSLQCFDPIFFESRMNTNNAHDNGVVCVLQWKGDTSID